MRAPVGRKLSAGRCIFILEYIQRLIRLRDRCKRFLPALSTAPCCIWSRHAYFRRSPYSAFAMLAGVSFATRTFVSAKNPSHTCKPSLRTLFKGNESGNGCIGNFLHSFAIDCSLEIQPNARDAGSRNHYQWALHLEALVSSVLDTAAPDDTAGSPHRSRLLFLQ